MRKSNNFQALFFTLCTKPLMSVCNFWRWFVNIFSFFVSSGALNHYICYLKPSRYVYIAEFRAFTLAVFFYVGYYSRFTRVFLLLNCNNICKMSVLSLHFKSRLGKIYLRRLFTYILQNTRPRYRAGRPFIQPYVIDRKHISLKVPYETAFFKPWFLKFLPQTFLFGAK